MVLIERPQIMTFEQSEKPGLNRKLAHEFKELVWIFLYLALFLLLHGERETGFDWRCDVVAVNVGIDPGLRGPR